MRARAIGMSSYQPKPPAWWMGMRQTCEQVLYVEQRRSIYLPLVHLFLSLVYPMCQVFRIVMAKEEQQNPLENSPKMVESRCIRQYVITAGIAPE